MNTDPSLEVKKNVMNHKKRKLTKEMAEDILFRTLKNVNPDLNIKDSESASPRAVNSQKTSSVKSTTQKPRKSRIIRLPRTGCTIPFLMASLNNISSSAACLDKGQLVNAVNVILKAKKDLAEGLK